jgi:hypothetical protein
MFGDPLDALSATCDLPKYSAGSEAIQKLPRMLVV